MTERNETEEKQKIWNMIRDIRVAMMATYDREQIAHARPMVAVSPSKEFDGQLWFYTRASSGKVADIETNPHVLLTYAEPSDENYVSITGVAEIIRDKEQVKNLWNEHMRTWFPKGTEDPDIALIKVSADSASYWDTPSSAVVYAYGYVKAVLTGKSPKPGEIGEVQLASA